MQGALVGMAFREVLKPRDADLQPGLRREKPPHCVRVVTIKPDDSSAAKQVRAAIDAFADCWASGDWPGPGGVQQDAEYLDVPTGREVDRRPPRPL
jgi:hypothetical protein